MTTDREHPGAADQRASASARKREVQVASIAGTLHAEVTSASAAWTLDAESAAGPDPVTAFLGALGGCLLMSLTIAARVRNAELGRASVRVSANEKGHVREIKVELEVQTALDDDRLARLVAVAERGCHIKTMLREDIAFNLEVRRGAD